MARVRWHRRKWESCTWGAPPHPTAWRLPTSWQLLTFRHVLQARMSNEATGNKRQKCLCHQTELLSRTHGPILSAVEEPQRCDHVSETSWSRSNVVTLKGLKVVRAKYRTHCTPFRLTATNEDPPPAGCPWVAVSSHRWLFTTSDVQRRGHGEKDLWVGRGAAEHGSHSFPNPPCGQNHLQNKT